jgi:predicted ribosome-associated RNA-binding protein Tma20
LLTGGLVSATGAINSDANIVAGTNAKSAPAIFYTNTANSQYGALLMQKAGVERWLIGSDNSTGNGNVVIRFNATTNYVTVTETGAVSITGNVTGANVLTGGLISATGNVTSGNLITGGILTATGNVISVANVIGGNITTAGVVTATGNVTGGNILTAGVVSATANVTGGNILTVGQISATGNITGNYYIGNGAFLTGLNAGAASQIANGATNISIPVASGNIAMSVQAQSNTVVISTGVLSMYGSFATPKTLSSNVVAADNTNAVLYGPVSIAPGYNLTIPTSSTLYIVGSF